MRQADTDVRTQHGEGTHENPSTPSGGASPRPPRSPAGRNEDWVGERLGEWQATELRVARGFGECRGLAVEQLEDIYQETALALLARPYGSEEHLRNALRHGIKHRALNMHRDTRRRAQILQQSAPSMQRIAEARETQAGPEEAALQDQDRLIVSEFLTELDELEQRVFWLIAEGMRYRAIAPILGVAVNEARNVSRSCERKRERFQLLYDTGRLCGYRAATIQSLQGGEVTTEELAKRAFAHLDACAQCRAEHKTNSRRLWRTFQDQLAAVLPLPALVAWAAWWRRPWPRAGSHIGGPLRERTAALIGAGGAGAKLTASVATVAMVAGGTVGATHLLEHSATHAHRYPNAPPVKIQAWAPPTASSGVSRHDIGVHAATRKTQTVWSLVSARVPASHVSTPGNGVTARLGGAEREFGPEAATSSFPKMPAATASHTAISRAEGAQREFGMP